MLINSQQVCLLSEHTHTQDQAIQCLSMECGVFYEHTSITEELRTIDGFWRRKKRVCLVCCCFVFPLFCCAFLRCGGGRSTALQGMAPQA